MVCARPLHVDACHSATRASGTNTTREPHPHARRVRAWCLAAARQACVSWLDDHDINSIGDLPLPERALSNEGRDSKASTPLVTSRRATHLFLAIRVPLLSLD